MTDLANAVSLTVNGLDYGGWKSVEISADLERQFRTFTLNITWQWPGQTLAVPIKPGSRCQVRIGCDLVLTGHVYKAPVSYDGKQISLSIEGSSLTRDLVDCAAINRPSQWQEQSVLSIVQALASPYGVGVVSEIAQTAKLNKHSIVPGETVFQSIDRLLTLYRVFSTDDAEGRVLLAKPGSGGRASDVLELGKNILSANAPMDFSQVFSEYRVIGQHKGSDSKSGSAVSEVSGVATDATAQRKRVTVISESAQLTPELAQQRADWESATRTGKALTTTYRVQGWRQSNGDLWRHNTQVRVIDKVLGFDQDMLISKVTYSLSEQGSITTLQVAPPHTFDANPVPPKS
ncbi:baseplate protein [Pseudomonas sp. FW306-02-F02-AA]|uniref:Baseplate protein n=1 Tax=Pseudomonas fluorescens TaxID=294 RepID=A0A0N9VR52_PSEFL|nr:MULTISPECIES: baseplate protein [Pseudomonas]ALI02647.1 baseplate protein [Pseudomonas fluorescens]PMZ05089.1 baseplate protein [Pseudomonas sp. FW306-02-F02-AB]PMZ10842.1 baseplate protein [Pseudomonas sp. FW306-02-H06C]PMZ15223.1 baseplate protein [Pseudomonas sp. FW306-02-F02-AA]PMZ22540.1 baseplate protein [Pseudomonas sp. FW306-02-F08-AA]